jgi:Chalcone isomerase-like
MSTPHILITLVVGLLLPAIVAADVNVSGASFPERMTVDGHPLVLNGYGVRETWWINLYAVALYLPHHSADVTFIKQDDVPRRSEWRPCTTVRSPMPCQRIGRTSSIRSSPRR